MYVLEHLKCKYLIIIFTMAIDDKNSIPYLDVLVTKTSTGRHSHKVYKKMIHNDRYQFQIIHPSNSNHHQAQTRGIIKTLVQRTKTLESQILRRTKTFTVPSANSYKSNDIKIAINPRRTVVTPTIVIEETNVPSTCLSSIHNETKKIQRLHT